MNEKDLKKVLQKVEAEYGKMTDLNAYYDSLLDYAGPDRIVSMEEVKRDIQALPRPSYRLETGFPSLDHIIEGFRPGNLVTISAPTKQGKTTLAQSMTKGFSERGHKSLWFSFEVPMAEFLEHFGDDIPNAYVPKEFPKNTQRRIEWISWRIQEAIAKYDIKAVFIDHLHFLLGMQELSVGNTSLMVGGIMRELKRIAISHEVTIFLIAHVKKSLSGSQPSLEDLRDSSFIAQESDIVIMMWRKLMRGTFDYSDKSQVAVRAHRRTGKVGSFTVQHENGLFHEHINDPSAGGKKPSAVSAFIQKGVSAVVKRGNGDEGYPKWTD